MPRTRTREARERFKERNRRTEPLFKVDAVEVCWDTLQFLARQAHRRGYTIAAYAGMILDRALKRPIRDTSQRDMFHEPED